MAFTSIPNEAIDRMTELSAGAWRLYCFLARCRNQTSGQCNPSVRTSAEAIDVHPKNIFKLRNELAAAGWARFDGDHATALFGIGSSKNATTAVDSSRVTATGSKNATVPVGSIEVRARGSKNATIESQKHYPAVAKTLPDGSKNATAYKEEQDERTRLIEQDEQHADAPRESRFSTEQITQYIKATKQHVYSVSGLTRYLKSNGEEDELISKWIEAREMADWPKWVFDPKEPGTVEEKKRFHLELCEAQRRAEAEALAFNQQQSAEEGAA